MKYKNFLIRLFDLILVLGLLAGYQAVIYSRDKEATIAELKSLINNDFLNSTNLNLERAL